MADDIVEQLRNHWVECSDCDTGGDCNRCLSAYAAADEIERLRTIAERLYIALDAHYGVGRDGTDHFTRMALASYEEEARRG